MDVERDGIASSKWFVGDAACDPVSFDIHDGGIRRRRDTVGKY